jgi:hypothetical protein
VTSDSYHFRLSLLWLSIGWALIGLVIYLSLTATPPEVLEFQSSDKVEHLLAYGTLMGWFGQLYPSFRRQVPWALGFCVLGILLEFLQGWGGSRTFDYTDMLANGFGVLLGWWLTRGWFAGVLQRVDQVLVR